MRNATEIKPQNTTASSRKLSPELNEFMHMLTMLDHHFAQHSEQPSQR